MPVQVLCPSCQKALHAPDELLGQQAECPYCKVRFQIPDLPGEVARTDGAGASRTGASAPPARSANPPGSSHGANSSQPGGSPAAPPLASPIAATQAPSSRSTSSVAAPPIAAKASSQAASPPLAPPSAAPASGAGPPAAVASTPKPPSPLAAKLPPLPPSANSSAAPPAKAQEGPKRARFITADAAPSRVRLGEDGQLPQLVLQESQPRERITEKANRSSPAVLIAVLAVSVGMSVLMLLVEPTGGRGEARTKADARQQIEQHYIASQPPFERYQELLRLAIQAHARGDHATERSLYRQVLDMLHAEGHNERSGLTGDPYGHLPPSDKDLEKQLSTLLSDR